MFKYEIEIASANARYVSLISEGTEIECAWARMDVFGMSGQGYNLSTNTALAIKKYYEWHDEYGYVRVKSAKAPWGIDRSDRDLFEKNNVNYPKCEGLYLIGQTFFNPITDEKFYWVKVGSAMNLHRRRKDYVTPTAMVWDIGYYLENDLTERDCHEILERICLHRHADEWFSLSREDYMAICEKGFEWFKEA